MFRPDYKSGRIGLSSLIESRRIETVASVLGMANQINIAIRGLFPTPVAAAELPDAAARNAELRQIILDYRRNSPSVQASNDGGWHSDRSLLSWGGPRVGEIIEAAKLMANRMMMDRAGKAVAPSWKPIAWANVNEAGNGNTCHYHPGAVWSGTYYVDDGGAIDNPALGGEFELLDPRGAAPAMYAPHLAFAGDGGRAVGATESIRPKPGLIILFPSWMFHQVRPYRGQGERISIAFNLTLAQTAD